MKYLEVKNISTLSCQHLVHAFMVAIFLLLFFQLKLPLSVSVKPFLYLFISAGDLHSYSSKLLSFSTKLINSVNTQEQAHLQGSDKQHILQFEQNSSPLMYSSPPYHKTPFVKSPTAANTTFPSLEHYIIPKSVFQMYFFCSFFYSTG